ncbi:hypothetical protein PS947_04294 [Pseudomonas fluorescens]|nr:hypothetical protein PS947_04294 [Pseudomonas fluorescens]
MGTTSLLSGETHTCVTFAVNASTPSPINPSTKKVKECSPNLATPTLIIISSSHVSGASNSIDIARTGGNILKLITALSPGPPYPSVECYTNGLYSKI